MPSLNYAKFDALYDSDEDREKANKQSEQTERARTYAERRQKAAAAAAAAGPAALAASLSPAEDKVTVIVPDGIHGGDAFMHEYEGTQLSVVCPAGCRAGDVISLTVRPGAAAAVALPSPDQLAQPLQPEEPAMGPKPMLSSIPDLDFDKMTDKQRQSVVDSYSKVGQPQKAVYKFPETIEEQRVICEAADALRQRGNELFKAGETVEAAKLYEQAVLKFADWYADCFATDEEKALVHAVKLPTHLNLATCSYKLGNYAHAVVHATQVLHHEAINTAGVNAKALYRRGASHVELGNLSQAHADLKRALDLSPADSEVRRALARLKVRRAEYVAAQRDMTRRMLDGVGDVSDYQYAPEEAAAGEAAAGEAAAGEAAAAAGEVTLPGYKTTYRVHRAGDSDGPRVAKGSSVTVHATGVVVETGKKFWSTKDQGQHPFAYTAGVGMVITGWDQGLLGMAVGEERIVTIPAAEGYGAGGFPQWGIPAGGTLKFTLEVLSIQPSTGGSWLRAYWMGIAALVGAVGIAVSMAGGYPGRPADAHIPVAE
jgi:FKBP-type peptidyl-prolyl cis-trans isomerase